MRISKYTFLFWDFINLSILLLISLFLISFYFKAHYIQTNYPDWIVHAFRIKLIKEYGLTSWTHMWSNGISIWRSYQFIPHYITIGISDIFHVDVLRGMVLTTITCFILFHMVTYCILRLLQFSQLASFICAILTFDIAQYWGGLSDYSLLFAFTFFPLYLFLFVKYYQGKIGLLFPYIIGLGFYIHPLLAVYSTVLWITALVFSRRKLLSITTFTQIIVFLAASTLFWFPLIFKGSYAYSSSTFATEDFLKMVINGYSYLGLSIFLFVALAITAFRMFAPLPKKFIWAKTLFIYITTFLVLIIIGINASLPKFIDQFQYTRGVTMIGIAIIFTFATFLDSYIYKSILLKTLAIFFSSLVLVEGLWFTSIYSPQPAKDNLESPIPQFLKISNAVKNNSGRLWVPNIDISSFMALKSMQFPYSYMEHLESNQIPPRIYSLILYSPFLDNIPSSNISRIDDYFKITGTKYAIFDELSPFTTAFKVYANPQYIDLGKIELPHQIYHVFEAPWELRNAVLINSQYQKDMMHFPFNLELSDVNDQIALDDYVKNFDNVLYQSNNVPLSINYPTQDSIEVKIPDKRKSNMVYINESYDASWKAIFDNKVQSIKPAGPNYMLVTLNSLNNGGILILKHYWPLSFYVSIYFILLIPILLATTAIMNKILYFAKKEEVYA